MSILQARVASALIALFSIHAGGAAAQIADRDQGGRDGIISQHYDGQTDDLLTAGLGKTGLGSATPPGVLDPLNPTTEELRRLAIYNNYRALVDPTPGGGYGTLYGPNVAADGTVTAGEGLIAGDEYITFERSGGRDRNVTLLVQIPDNFDLSNPCIVTAPSSGSRGIYGAIATAGEWGLKHRCAVAYTDKGTGTGAHDLQNDRVNLIQGQFVPAAQARDDAIFRAALRGSELAAFRSAFPDRFAFKHAHSQSNPEKDWGKNVLSSIRFAFRMLDQKYGNGRITKRNTIVIASSVSNGGGASVRAAEDDSEGLIDGIAVGEPNVNPVYSPAFTIQQGSGAPLLLHSRPLIDYITFINVFQPCASAAAANAAAPFNTAPSPARCASLHEKALLNTSTLAEQADEAQKKINDFGILTEQNLVQPGYTGFGSVSRSIAVTYANSYARASVTDNLCDFSLGATSATNNPAPLTAAAAAILFSTSNGIPPTGGVNLINNAAPGGALEERASTPDQNLDGALCLRSLATGRDAATAALLPSSGRSFARNIRASVGDILADGRLGGIPAIFVTGRNDGILPPNFTSRAYYGLNKTREGANSPLRYYEVTNAHHLDSFNQLPGYNALYIPLHRYYIQALDLMYDHLKNRTPLPPSQVVRTTPRGPAAPPITAANVPPISQTPADADLIRFTPGKPARLLIPE
ncbi:MAG TPA: 3-hydroxybutyrate oligomer hydrolase family protein [Hyphomicrobiales bacterium]